MNAKRQMKIEDKVITNLDYLRLKADVYAVEALIRDSSPTAEQESEQSKDDFWSKIINGVKGIFKKEISAKKVEDLQKQEAEAKQALVVFESLHTKKHLKLSENQEKFKAYINKKLFKKDKNGLKRIRFALSYMILSGGEYQCEDDSLMAVSEILFNSPERCVELRNSLVTNYNKISVSDEETYSLSKEFYWNSEETGLKGLFKNILRTFNHLSEIARHGDDGFTVKAISPNQMKSLFATELTLIEEGAKILEDADFKKSVKELLAKVAKLRAESEYAWLVDKTDSDESKEKVDLCNEVLSRLAEIVE